MRSAICVGVVVAISLASSPGCADRRPKADAGAAERAVGAPDLGDRTAPRVPELAECPRPLVVDVFGQAVGEVLETYAIECNHDDGYDRIFVVFSVVDRVVDPRREVEVAKAQRVLPSLVLGDEMLLNVYSGRPQRTVEYGAISAVDDLLDLMWAETERQRLDALARELGTRPSLLAQAATGLSVGQADRLVAVTQEWLGDTWNEGEHVIEVESVRCGKGRCDFELEIDWWRDEQDLQKRSVGFTWVEPRPGADIEWRFFEALGRQLQRLTKEAPTRPAAAG